MNKLPLARSKDLVVHELDKEILIYDLSRHRAYNLNETSSIVYKACDGKTSFEDLKTKSNFTDDIIFLALDGLKKENLIGEYKTPLLPKTEVSRRAAIGRLGLAALFALPLITGLVVPTAAQAGSTIVCGDGDIQGSEECDDGNTANGDGCSSSCSVESGFVCSGEPSVCVPL